MKRFIYIITALMIFGTYALGAYSVEIEDDEFVSNEKYFAPSSTWYDVEAQRINLDKGKIIFHIGKDTAGERINAEVMPINASDKSLTYKSEDTSVAAVDASGLVTPAGKVGNTMIDIRCGEAMAKVKVQVVKGVEGVELSQSEMTLYADKPVTAQLTAVITPSDATIQDVKWYSADESVAYVDEEGLVSPNGVGETEVYAQSEDGDFKAKCKVTVTTWEKRKREIPVIYTDYAMTVEEMVEAQMKAEPTVFTSSVFPADEEGVEQYVNPENLVTGYEKYQFINLGAQNGVDAQTLDAYLRGKGVLSGHGDTFKKAAEDNEISEVYLVIHACLETGSGTSALASGIDYDGTTVYNMFGIGAIDADPEGGGAKYAYEQGWTSVEAAIEGGARWISENYINNPSYSQNTLYKMRWNPERPAVHQYATDIAWASKQAKSMSGMFEAFPTAEYVFDVPSYTGQGRLEIK